MKSLTEMSGPNVAQPIDVSWRKSRRSHDTGACVEVALAGSKRLVRDSKAPGTDALEFGGAEWSAFFERIKGREFDR
jgi:hypothetical protein